MGKLIGRSNRAEVDRGTVIDGEGQILAGSLMAAAAGRLNFGRERVNRAQGWVKEGEGEVREVGVCGNELGRRGAVGTNAGGGSVRARCNVSARKKGEGENGHGSVGIRMGARARWARFIDDRRVVVVGAVAGRRHGRAYGVTGEYSNRVELV